MWAQVKPEALAGGRNTLYILNHSFMSTFLKRYQAGKRITVWNEIRALGAEVRSPHYYEDVKAVVDETMDRVRYNLDLLVARLREDGYKFVWPGHENYYIDRSRCLPNEDTPELIALLEQLTGPIPLVISSWMLRVGDVNLVGNHPKWPEPDMYTDALVVEFEYKSWGLEDDGARSYYEMEYNNWQSWVKEDGLEAVGPFSLAFAPDVYHKVNVSGGTPYAIILPNAGADALIEIYGKQSYFVDYLRECFKWGGFPGFGDKEKGRDNGTIVELVVGLLDI
jgi:hypothetical protein